MFEYMQLQKNSRVQSTFMDALKWCECSALNMYQDAHDKLHRSNTDLDNINAKLTDEERNDLHNLSIELSQIESQLSDILDLFDPDPYSEIETLKDADDFAFHYHHAIKAYTRFCERHDIFYKQYKQARERHKK